MKNIKKYTKKGVEEFLRESNAVEGVYDETSFKQAKKAWEFLSTCSELTIKAILRTHRILMQNSRHILLKQKGFFRQVPVWVGGREGLRHDLIPIAMEEWLKDVETSLKIPGRNGKHFKLDHITYEEIHPFVDGNGRTGRMFMNWERMKVGLPILIIHSHTHEHWDYYAWFRKIKKS